MFWDILSLVVIIGLLVVHYLGKRHIAAQRDVIISLEDACSALADELDRQQGST